MSAQHQSRVGISGYVRKAIQFNIRGKKENKIYDQGAI